MILKEDTGLRERLERLVDSGLCPARDVSEHAAKLREITDDITLKREKIREASKIFKALADETRLMIVRLLEFREMCVCEIMVALGLTQPTASHHLGILENVGLIKSKKRAKWVFYSIADPKLIEALHQLNLF
ncbi:MAG: ArsR/SmtB family transcription factor [Candidatus Bathyarchaeia archaeon]